MIETSVVDVTVASLVEAEFDRLRAARPALLSRIGRAEDILVTHLACPKAGMIRPRIRGGEWVACERCEGSGRALVFVYPKRRLQECAGCRGRFPHRELVEVTKDHESLTWFPGDKLCGRDCAGAHGVL